MQNILQEQGLPVNGVKADLVARILASQQSGSTKDASAAADTNAEAAGHAATTSAPSAKAAEQSEPSGTTAGESSTAAVPALPEATSKETEAERRAKRAARFGDASGNDDEAAKKARQERFGIAGDAVEDKVGQGKWLNDTGLSVPFCSSSARASARQRIVKQTHSN